MADGWKYDLELDADGFVKPMKDSAVATGRMTEEAKKLAAEQWRAQKAAAAQAEAEKMATAALEKEATVARAAAAEAEKLAQAQTNAAVGTNKLSHGSRALIEDMGKAARETQKFSQIARSVTAQAGAQLANTVGQIGRDMEGTAGKVVGAISNIGAATAAGSMLGPWGAAVAGSLAAVREAYVALSGPSERQIELDKQAASAAEALADATERKAQRLRDAAAAGRESVQASTSALREREQAEGDFSRASQGFQERRAALERESRRIAAGKLPAADRIEVERKLALEEIQGRHAAEGAGLQQGVDSAQREVDRVALTKRNSEMARNRLPRGADGERAKLTAEIEQADADLRGLRAELEKRKDALRQHSIRSPQLMELETRNTNAAFDQRAGEQRMKDSEEERKRQMSHPLHPDNIAARKRAAAEEAQAGLDKRREGLVKQINQMPEAAEAPRRGREGAAPGSRESRKIYGVVSKNTIGTSPQDRLRDAGMLAQRARKAATSEEGPATEKQVQMLERILAELKKQTRKPDRTSSP